MKFPLVCVDVTLKWCTMTKKTGQQANCALNFPKPQHHNLFHHNYDLMSSVSSVGVLHMDAYCCCGCVHICRSSVVTAVWLQDKRAAFVYGYNNDNDVVFSHALLVDIVYISHRR